MSGVAGGSARASGAGGDAVDGGAGADGLAAVGEEFSLLVSCEEGTESTASSVGSDEGIGGIRRGDGGRTGALEGGSLGIGNSVMAI